MSLHCGKNFSISKQGLHKRIGYQAVAFLLQVLTDLLSDSSGEVLEEFRGAGFRRILVEDSSSLCLPKANAELFPAHGNAKGAAAGVKCHLRYDLLTRVLLTVNLTSHDGKTLEETLKNASGNEIDCQIFAGKGGHRCRLIAIRADEKVAEKRRRERGKKARELGKTALRAALIRDGWHLMITNIPKEEISATTLAALYRSRWAIEIQFRAWKQSTKMNEALNRKSNRNHLAALILSSMRVGLLGLRHLALFASKVGLGKTSPEKMTDWIANGILGEETIENLTTAPPDIRHVQRDTRRRKSPVLEGISGLS